MLLTYWLHNRIWLGRCGLESIVLFNNIVQQSKNRNGAQRHREHADFDHGVNPYACVACYGNVDVRSCVAEGGGAGLDEDSVFGVVSEIKRAGSSRQCRRTVINYDSRRWHVLISIKCHGVSDGSGSGVDVIEDKIVIVLRIEDELIQEVHDTALAGQSS